MSAVLFGVVPSLTCLLALICCICHKGNGIKGKQELCADAKFSKPAKKVQREKGQEIYIRRLGSKHYNRHLKEQENFEATPGGETPGQTYGGTPGATEMQMAMFSNAQGGVGSQQRIDTEAPMMTDRPMLTQPDLLDGGREMDRDRFEDDGESHDFTDTENEHFSAPGQFVPQTFQEADFEDEFSQSSNQAHRDRTHNKADIRATAKSNARQ